MAGTRAPRAAEGRGAAPGSGAPGSDPAGRRLSAEGAGPRRKCVTGRGASPYSDYVAQLDSEMRPVAVETEGP